jgi:hypothetical protein
LADLGTMLKNEPFHLTDYYSDVMIKYIFETQDPVGDLKVSSEKLIKKLRKVIEDF